MLTEQEWVSIRVDHTDDQTRVGMKQGIVSNLIQRERQQKKVYGQELAEAEKNKIDKKILKIK